MITYKEMFKRPTNVSSEIKANIEKLLIAVNKMRLAYGKPLQVTSGYRSLEDHLAIYAAKGIIDQSKIPMQSNHLKGLAVDLVPLSGSVKEFQDWIIKNYADKDLYFEDFEYSKSWVHAQLPAPKSNNRFFKP